MNMNQKKSAALNSILRQAVTIRRLEITNYLYERTAGRVEAGPFRGMRLVPKTSWGDGDLAAKLLGFYEEELIGEITRASVANYRVVINIGCAEGYYAVGLARLMPNARIVAFDTDPKSCEICKENAAVNGVADRVEVRGNCTIESLQSILSEAHHALLVVDCEGAEHDLLSPSELPALNRCDMIVECHDFVDRSITATLRQRFASSHDIELIPQAGRNPHRSELLRPFAELSCWLIICENRPEAMHWLVFHHHEPE